MISKILAFLSPHWAPRVLNVIDKCVCLLYLVSFYIFSLILSQVPVSGRGISESQRHHRKCYDQITGKKELCSFQCLPGAKSVNIFPISILFNGVLTADLSCDYCDLVLYVHYNNDIFKTLYHSIILSV